MYLLDFPRKLGKTFEMMTDWLLMFAEMHGESGASFERHYKVNSIS